VRRSKANGFTGVRFGRELPLELEEHRLEVPSRNLPVDRREQVTPQRGDDSHGVASTAGIGRAYASAGEAPRRVTGTIQLRTGPIEVDETLLDWEKRLSGGPHATLFSRPDVG
jgi:hypothetical protein